MIWCGFVCGFEVKDVCSRAGAVHPALLSAVAGLETLRAVHTWSGTCVVENPLRRLRVGTRPLLDSSRIGVLLFVVPQRRESTRHDAWPWNLDVRWQSFGRLPSRKSGTSRFWEGPMESFHTGLGTIVCGCCVRHFHASNGLAVLGLEPDVWLRR